MLRPLHNVACLGIVAAFLAGCTVSDAEPQPAVGTAAAASPASPAPDTADDEAREDQASIDLGGWSMPEPGPFDLATYQANPFEPCKEIPEGVLSDLGMKKEEISSTDVSPFTCILRPLEQGLYSMNSLGYAAEGLREQGYLPVESKMKKWGGYAQTMKNGPGQPIDTCLVAVETARGTIVLSHVNSRGTVSDTDLCAGPSALAASLYGGYDGTL